MGELFITILIFGAVIAITAVIFGGWMIVGIARLLFRILAMVLGIDRRNESRHQQPISLPGSYPATCPNAQCRASNPADARFCRRCGVIMPTPQRVQVRRAAMW